MSTLTANFDASLSSSDKELATWNRPRSSEELQAFIARHHASLPEGIDVE